MYSSDYDYVPMGAEVETRYQASVYSREDTPASSAASQFHSRHSSVDFSQWAQSAPLPHAPDDEGSRRSSPSHGGPHPFRSFGRHTTPDFSVLLRELEQTRRERDHFEKKAITLENEKKTVETRFETLSFAFNSVTGALPGLLKVSNPLGEALPSPSGTPSTLATPTVMLLPPKLTVPKVEYCLATEIAFPKVRFWTREDYNKELKAKNATSQKPDNFLEDELGNPLSKDRKKAIGKASKGFFIQMFGQHIVPRTWGVSDANTREFYYISMANKFPEFRFCQDHWKADLYATENYPSCQKNHAPGGKKVKKEPKTEDDELLAVTIGDKRKGTAVEGELDAKRTKVMTETTVSEGIDSPPSALLSDIPRKETPPAEDHAGPTRFQIKPTLGNRGGRTINQPESTPRATLGEANKASSAVTISVAAQETGTQVAPAVPVGSDPASDEVAQPIAEQPPKATLAVPKPTGSLYTPSATSVTPRNLCGLEWKQEYPKGTTADFAKHWESIQATDAVKRFNRLAEEKKAGVAASATQTRRSKTNAPASRRGRATAS